jgi:kanamycin kinase
MTRTRITPDLSAFPADVRPFLTGAAIYDSSCSPEARVYFIDRDGGIYLKSAAAGSLRVEAEKAHFFHGRGLGAEVLTYLTEGERDWFATRAVRGEDCTHADYLAEPARLASLLGETLRWLHEMPTEGCPAPDYLHRYTSLVESNYRSGNYD